MTKKMPAKRVDLILLSPRPTSYLSLLKLKSLLFLCLLVFWIYNFGHLSFVLHVLVLDEYLDLGGESPLVTTVNIRLKSMLLELATV